MNKVDKNMEFSHLDQKGNPSMVDIGGKTASKRNATAICYIDLPPPIYEAFENDEIHTKKGPVFQTAIIAGIQGAKKTSDLIPMCHPLPIDNISIEILRKEASILEIRCSVGIFHKTGVEMEALTGASVAALTIYDMCKGLSHDIVIRDLQLVSKSGGKHDVNRQA